MTIGIGIPGADELIGKGVYRGMPADVPRPVQDGHAVVVGGARACAAAARRLTDAGWRVTVVTRERDGGCLRRDCRRRVGTEVVCAAGIDHLEVLVLRRVDTGRIEACHVAGFFVL